MKLLFLTILLIACTNASLSISSASTMDELKEFVINSLKDHKDALKQLIPTLVNSPPTPSDHSKAGARLDYVTCDACQAAIPVLKALSTSGFSDSTIISVVVGACTALNIAEAELCRGAVNSFGPSVIRISVKEGLRTNDICGLLMNGCGYVNSTMWDWDIDIDENKPPVVTPEPLDPNLTKTQILQFTDIHLDLDYVVGSNADCKRPAGCCRDGVGDPEWGTAAGEFGHFSCSLPEKALDAIYDDAFKRHQHASYIFLTGDYIHSAIWLYNVTENTRHLERVTKKLAARFEGTPIYPVVGNHECDVVNMYPPEEVAADFNLTWMYNVVMEPFGAWVPPNERITWRKGGYYSVRPDRDVPFRLVVLNTNLCYLQNFWLPYNSVDPADQLQWFADTMLAAEKAGETVYILGHIQPGSGSCWRVWSDKFDRIVKRFEGIIKAQFYGHSHREYFTLAMDGDKPVSASFVSPSGVTDAGHSAYKLFEVDGARGVDSTWEVIDHTTYILNLTSSNANPTGEADILPLYSAKEEFGLTSLRPQALYDLVLKMVTDRDLFEKFIRIHRKGAPRNYNNGDMCWDDQCRANMLCDLVTSNSGDDTACAKIRNLVFGETTPRPASAPGLKSTLTLIPVVLAFLLRNFL